METAAAVTDAGSWGGMMTVTGEAEKGAGSRAPRSGGPRRRRWRGTTHAPTTVEVSAGGVVVRRIAGRVHVALLKTIHSRGEVWVLPKGHVEKHRGETLSEAAVREVQEELGIADVRLKRKLGITQYQFFTERGRIVKTVHYYLMDGRSEELHPQAEEGLLEAAWVPIRDALKRITYPVDRSIVLRGVSRGGILPRRGGARDTTDESGA